MLASAILLSLVYGCGGGGGSPTVGMPGDGGQMPGDGDTPMMPAEPGDGDTPMMPAEPDSIPLPADFSFVGSSSFNIRPGQSVDRGLLRFMCEGSASCQVEIDAANDVARFTGGMLIVADVPVSMVEPNFTLRPGERRLFRVPGTDNITVFGCGHTTERCIVDNFRWDEVGSRWEWNATENNRYFFGTPHESGFFMEGEITITAPNGRSITLSCPSGCPIARVWVDEQGNPRAERVVLRDGNGNEIPLWQVPVQVAQDGVRLDTPIALNPGTDGEQPRPTTPANVWNYPGLSDRLPNIAINHWEVTDGRDTYSPLGRRIELLETVCPGLLHNGNECNVQRRDGSRSLYTVEDMLSKFVDAEIIPIGGVITRAGYYGYSSFYIDKSLDFAMFGIWGEYSVFGDLALHHTDDGTGLSAFEIEHYFAWGDLYYGFPTPVGNEQGTATWEGIAMAGSYNWDSNANAIYSSVRPDLSYSGFSTVTYDFSERDVDVSIELLGNHSFGTLEWDNIPQNHDGSFFLQGNHLPNTPINLTGQGYIDGDFYGPNAEEVAGVFQRVYDSIYLEGAFGGRRQ